MSRSVLLIDGSNIFEAAKQLRRRVDFVKLLNWVNDNPVIPELSGAYYFTATPSDRDTFSSVIRLVDFLSFNGYICETKNTSVYDNEGVTRVKGNMDIDMAIMAVRLCSGNISDMIFVTGDGDFVPVLRYVQERGIRVTVISTRKGEAPSDSPLVSNALRRQANDFIDLADLPVFTTSDFA